MPEGASPDSDPSAPAPDGPRQKRRRGAAGLGPAPQWWLLLTLAVSVLAHGLFALLVLTELRPPDLGIEIELPAEVEFGLTEAVAMRAPPAPPPPAPPPSKPEDEPAIAPEPGADGGPEKPRDAGAKPDSGARKKDAAAADAGTPEPDAASPRDAGAAAGDAGTPRSQLPPGAQIAVRVDMRRIRESPIAEDVERFLGAIPDWKAILDGSGIEPMKELDRLLIATPNLKRSRLVMAGRHLGGKQRVDQAVSALARARGVEAPWRVQDGVPVADWANADTTPRVIAVVGPSHFVISRAEDLPKIVAIAAARADARRERKADAKDQAPEQDPGAEPPVHPADALLSMEEGEGVSLEVEGARNFVRRGRGIPSWLRLSALEREGRKVELRGVLQYDDQAQAEDARRFWDGARKAYARNTLVALLGLSAPLQRGDVRREGDRLLLRAELNVQQCKLILGYLRELVAPPPPAPPLQPLDDPAGRQPSGSGGGDAPKMPGQRARGSRTPAPPRKVGGRP